MTSFLAFHYTSIMAPISTRTSLNKRRGELFMNHSTLCEIINSLKSKFGVLAQNNPLYGYVM